MKARKSGARHPLLFYRRTMDRVWRVTFLLGLILVATGWWALIRETEIFGIGSDIWLFATAVVAFALSAFAFFSRYVAYVQVHRDYFSVVTPFLRFRISFRRMRTVHPVLIQQVFPKEESSWAQRNFLEPFYGKTALVMELKGYPLSPILLRLFLPAQMFSTQSIGFVLLVPDWMKLSTELDSFHGVWLQRQSSRRR